MAWAPDYITGTELLEVLVGGETLAGSPDELAISWAIPAACRSIDQRCKRQFGQTDATEVRVYASAAASRVDALWYELAIDDIHDATTLAVSAVDTEGNATAVDSSSWELRPVNAPANGRPYTTLALRGALAYRYSLSCDDWGWSAVPEPIKQAALTQAHRFLRRKESPYGIAGSPDSGSEMRLLHSLDPDVRAAVRPYRRWRSVT